MVFRLALLVAAILASCDTALYLAAELPTPAESKPDSPEEPLRTWVDSTGQHETRAALVRQENDKVWLQRQDGTRIVVALDKLSEADRTYVRNRSSGGNVAERIERTDSRNDVSALLAQGGEVWSSLERYEAFQTKLVAGKRFWIWPVEDLPLAVDEQGTVTVRLNWRVRPGQKAVNPPEGESRSLCATLVAEEEGTGNPVRWTRLHQVRLAAGEEATLEVSERFKPGELSGTANVLFYFAPLSKTMEELLHGSKTPVGVENRANVRPRRSSQTSAGGLSADSESERPLSNLIRIPVRFSAPPKPRNARPGEMQLLYTWSHAAVVLNARFNDSGDEVISMGADSTVRFWDVASGTPKSVVEIARPLDKNLRVLSGPYGPPPTHCTIHDMAFLPGGRRWLIREDTLFLLWDASRKKAVEEYRGAVDLGVLAYVVQRDKMLFIHNAAAPKRPGTLAVSDLKTGKPVRFLEGHGDLVARAWFSPDGERLLTVCNSDKDRSVRWWDVGAGKLLSTFSKPGLWVNGEAVSLDRTKALLVTPQREMIVWDLNTGKELGAGTLTAEGAAHGCALVGDGRRAVVSTTDQGSVLWLADTSDFKVLARQPIEDPNLSERENHGLAVSPDGRHLISFDGGKTSVQKDRGRRLRLWELPE